MQSEHKFWYHFVIIFLSFSPPLSLSLPFHRTFPYRYALGFRIHSSASFDLFVLNCFVWQIHCVHINGRIINKQINARYNFTTPQFYHKLWLYIQSFEQLIDHFNSIMIELAEKIIHNCFGFCVQHMRSGEYNVLYF